LMSCYLGYIAGRQGSYNDVTSDWQQCMFEPNYAILPIAEAAEGNPTLELLEQLGFPIDPQDKQLSMGNFLNSLIYVGTIVTVLTMLGHAAIHRSWGQETWILTSACFGFWCTMLSVTYYTASPPLPVPSATTSTLFLLMYWLRERYFDDVNNGDNECGEAYRFLVLFIALCVIMVFSLMMANIMAFTIEYERYKLMVQQQNLSYGKFRGAGVVLTLAVGMMFCYTGMVSGRIVSSFVSVDCFRNFDMTLEEFTHPDANTTNVGLYYPDIHYPFQPGTANITTLLWAVIFVTVVRVFFTTRPAGLKIIGVSSLLYVLINSASMVYLLSLYFEEDLNKDSVCFRYFSDPERSALYGYPDGKQSRMLCQATRVSTFLAFNLYLLNHFMFWTCAYLYNHVEVSEDEVFINGMSDEPDLGGFRRDSEFEVMNKTRPVSSASRDNVRSRSSGKSSSISSPLL